MDGKATKQQLLDELYKPYKKCLECPLGTLGRKNVVFGEGNPDADVMFVGEGPGRDEDEQGRPFVGRSGKLLTNTLEKIGFKREEVFIANIVKCRPPNNRLPLPIERETCKNLLLLKQISIIQPQIICTLGSCAAQDLLEDKTLKITKARGSIFKKNGMLIMPIYHPAYILRNPREATTFVNDLREVCLQALQLSGKHK